MEISFFIFKEGCVCALNDLLDTHMGKHRLWFSYPYHHCPHPYRSRPSSLMSWKYISIIPHDCTCLKKRDYGSMMHMNVRILIAERAGKADRSAVGAIRHIEYFMRTSEYPTGPINRRWAR